MKSDGFARNILGPDDLRLASEAFEAALAEVGESELHPYEIRKNLAQHVMQKIFAGERDREALREGALTALRTVEEQFGAGNHGAEDFHVAPTSSNRNIRRLFLSEA
jgi:hypothetical protein